MSQQSADEVAGPGAAGARLFELEQQLVSKAERCQQVQREVALIRVSAPIGDGSGELTVDSAGVLTDLRLTARAGNVPPDRLAAEIMRSARQAQARLAGHVEEATQRVAPEETGLRDRLVAIQRDRFDPPPTPPSRGPSDDDPDDSFLVR